MHKWKKKLLSFALMIAMVSSSLPMLGMTVHAENTMPDETTFLTKDQLKTFDTDSSTQNPAAKVYFGKNKNGQKQKWWIAGSQGENAITLFAASPLQTGVQFHPNEDRHKYDEGNEDVFASHYGASEIRKTLKSLVSNTDYFSSAEQELMNTTTIHTDDALNNEIYLNNDKLYLAYGEYRDTKVTVGKNGDADGTLNNGLPVDMAYWGDYFWLRAPFGDLILLAVPDDGVTYGYVNYHDALRPAFELNLTSVIFASAAPAASSAQSYTLENTSGDGAYTLRYDANGTLGSAKISIDKSKVTLTDVPSGAYLVAQTNTEVKKVEITDQKSITASDMGLDNFENCKVWLEKTEDGITKAVLATESHENILPDETTFVTKEQLKNFDTDTSTENPATKVYFGRNQSGDKQKWWIAGSQGENAITLFADRPLKVGVEFHSSRDIHRYEEGNKDVYPNHYGASKIRETLKSWVSLEAGASTDYFSTAEKNLMNKTTIYTKDLSDGEIYSNIDKLYLPYGVRRDTKVIVGENGNEDNKLNNGFPVDVAYWGIQSFWLRAPFDPYGLGAEALVAYRGLEVSYGDVSNVPYPLQPAFELNLTSVLFASAVPAAPSAQSYALENTSGDGAYTLRYDANGTLGSAEISIDKSKVTLTDVPSGTYLVAQTNTEVKKIEITDHTSVTASDMELDDFENCKVWLEKTTDEVTYATLATQKETYAVNVTAGIGLTITSNNGEQDITLDTAISDITVTANTGYYIPDTYEVPHADLNGLTITNKTASGFTLTGTPTDDVNITLPDATEKTEQTAPNVTGGVGASIHGTDELMEYASSADSQSWTQCSASGTEVGAGTWYVRYKETETKKASPATEVEVIAPSYTIEANMTDLNFGEKNENYEQVESQAVMITNKGNSTVTLTAPTSQNYQISLDKLTLAADEIATLTVTPTANLETGTYNETLVVGNTKGDSINLPVSFKVNGVFNVELDADKNRIVDGETVTLTATTTGGSDNKTYTWYAGEAPLGDTTSEIQVTPNQTTTYKVVVTDTIENKSATATITVIPKNYALEVPSDYVFDKQKVGYEDISTHSFTIKNTGNVDITNLSVSLIGENAGSFTLNQDNVNATLTPEQETSFTVKPNHGLAAGVYAIQVQITGDNGISKTINLSFTVDKYSQTAPEVTGGIGIIQGLTTAMEYAKSHDAQTWDSVTDAAMAFEAGDWYVRYKETDDKLASEATKVTVTAPVHSITTDVEEAIFDTKEEGYAESGLSKKVTITNNGNVEIKNLTMALAGDGKDAFTLDTDSLESELTTNGTTSFTVVPKAGLGAGTYVAKVNITADNNISKTINVSFEVKKKDSIEYPFVEEYLATYHLNSDDKIVLHSEGDLSKFQAFYMDDKLVDSSNYTLENGSTKLTLKNSYLDTLALGKHSFKMEYTDGYSKGEITVVESNKTVVTDNGKTTPSESKTIERKGLKETPKTGDTSQVGFYGMTLMLSLIALLGVVILKKRKLS